MSNEHHIGRMSLLIFLLVVITLSGATANNIALTEKEIEVLAENDIGLLNGGIRVAKIDRSQHPDGTAIIITDVSFFNTMNESQTFNIKKEQFWEEREHTVKENYIFYLIPDLNWVEVPSQITVEPFSKYIMPVTITMPIEEGFNKAKGGGFICMIGASRVGVETTHAHKLFLLLEEETGAGFDLGFNPMYLLSLVVVGGVIVAVVLYKRRQEKYEYEEDYEEYETN